MFEEYQINEIFSSVQGEGVRSGIPASFIRLQGCPVGCRWCDSVRTWGPNAMTVAYMHGWLEGFGKTMDGVFGQDPLQYGTYTYFKERLERTVNKAKEYEETAYDKSRGYVAGVMDAYEVKAPPRLDEVPDPHGAVKLIRSANLTMAIAGAGFDLNVGSLYDILGFYRPMMPIRGVKAPANGKTMNVMEIVAATNMHDDLFIITGGEPILFDLDPLIGELLNAGVPIGNICIETSGMRDFKGKRRPGWVTWSPKENLKWQAPEDFMRYVSEVKFVVDERLPMTAVLGIMAWYQAHAILVEFVFMPEGSPPSPESMHRTYEMVKGISAATAEHSPRIRIADRLQYRLGVR